MKPSTVAKLKLLGLIVAIGAGISTMFTNFSKATSNASIGSVNKDNSELREYDPKDCLTAEDTRVKSPDRDKILSLLKSYYRNLTTGHFDADRYFAPNVRQFFTGIRNASNADITKYINGPYLKQYKNVQASMQEDSLITTGTNAGVFIAYGNFFEVQRRQYKEVYACVRIEWNDDVKLVSLYEPKILGGTSRFGE